MQIIMYYEIMFILSMILSFVYVCKWHSRYSVYFTVLFLIIPIANLGYWNQVAARSVEQALLGNKMSYLGGCFGTLAITLSILTLCKVGISKLYRCLMFLASMIVYILALTAGYSPIFYKDVTYEIQDGVGKLIKDYSPLHYSFYILMVIYFLVCFVGLIKGARKRKEVSIKMVGILFVMMSISMFVFFFGKKIWRGIELLPVCYVMSQGCFLIIAHRLVLYNVDEVVVDAEIGRGDVGAVAVDLERRFLGCNAAARKYFAEFDGLIIDNKVPEDKGICERLYLWMGEIDKTRKQQEFVMNEGERVFRVTGDYLWEGGNIRGYHFVIRDHTDEQRYIDLLNNYNVELEEDVRQKTAYLVEMHDRLVLGMANMVENRDNSTGGHIKRTSQVVKILVEEMRKDPDLGLTPEFCDAIVKAAPMHDLGKIAVDDAILRKPGRFLPEEFEQMKTHAEKGAEIVRQLLSGLGDAYFARIAENVAHFHHERMDGSGYPCGLVGEEIPFEARVMAIADVYDALVRKRCYKESMSFEQADRIIQEGMGTQFDPKLNPYYVRCRERLEEYYSSQGNRE